MIKFKQNIYIVFAGMGIELVGIIVTMAFLGNWFDQTYNWGGFGVMGGVLIAFSSWIYHLIILMKQIEKSEKNNK